MIPIIIITVCFIIGAIVGWKGCYSLDGDQNWGRSFSNYISYGIGAFVVGLGFALIELFLAFLALEIGIVKLTP